ncbi:hypothetical protein ACFOZ1_03340 [Gracilibacillus marinus]|uniref:DUF1440 domain-containing protein n=1 Tax=Gracilibacillus marinus TaxID=630535 RepID=A0ABV8VQV4_9BACI
MFIQIVRIGTISGLLLGGILYGLDILFHKKIYVLLMNVDFIPIFQGKQLPLLVEWSFHLIISFIIVWIYLLLWCRLGNNMKRLYFSVLLGIVAGISYFPLTIVAIKATPAINDFFAIILWFSAHVIYGLSMYLLVKWERGRVSS